MQQREGVWSRCGVCGEWIEPWTFYEHVLGVKTCEGCMVTAPIGGMPSRTSPRVIAEIQAALTAKTCSECFCLQPCVCVH